MSACRPAALCITNTWPREEREELAEQLQRALDARVVIEHTISL
jgi:hypothetical protein